MTNSNILIYRTEDGKTKIETRLKNETMRKIGISDFSTNPTLASYFKAFRDGK